MTNEDLFASAKDVATSAAGFAINGDVEESDACCRVVRMLLDLIMVQGDDDDDESGNTADSPDGPDGDEYKLPPPPPDLAKSRRLWGDVFKNSVRGGIA